MSNIIFSILILCGLGVFFGIVLAYAAKKFHVPVDARLQEIISKLPGVNCGSCGRAGCAGFAEALLAGELNIRACSVMPEENRKEIAELLGLSITGKDKQVASLRCCGGSRAKDKYTYTGTKDCLAAHQLLGGQKECRYGCLTYGTCIEACRFGAIEMTGDGVPRVIKEKCTACGVCVGVCPKKLFVLIPYETAKAPIYVACSSHDMGRGVLNVCSVGCIACRRCEKACAQGAIQVIDNLAVIDYTKCSGCLACVKVCPTKVIKTRA